MSNLGGESMRHQSQVGETSYQMISQWEIAIDRFWSAPARRSFGFSDSGLDNARTTVDRKCRHVFTIFTPL